MFHLIPRRWHRGLMPIAHVLRHRWRVWRGQPLAGCSIIVTDLEGHLLLVRHSYGPKVWSLPGGGIGKNEDPADAARRELLEETGCAVSVVNPVGTLEEVISGSPHVAHVYSAKTDQPPRPDCREVIEARFFPLHSLPEPLSRMTRRRLEMWREHSKK